MRAETQVGFTPDAGPVSTAMGTFTDVVTVQVDYIGGELLNAAPDGTPRPSPSPARWSQSDHDLVRPRGGRDHHR